MRLISAEIAGYGRLVKTKVNLDSKAIAVVGPNEAGKTTFLKALSFLNSNKPLGQIDRSRAEAVDGQANVIRVKFGLNDDDRAALADLDLDEPPRTMWASRKADGGEPHIEIEPHPRKSRSSLQAIYLKLQSAIDRPDVAPVDSGEELAGGSQSDIPQGFVGKLDQLLSSISETISLPEDSDMRETARLARQLAEAVANEPIADNLRSALKAASEWFAGEDPLESAKSILWSRAPKFLLFNESDRTLESSYRLDKALVANPPAALRNLVRIADLDLGALESALTTGDIARRKSATRRANKRLAKTFKNSWKQSILSVELSVDGPWLRVSIIENDLDVTVFSERSAGLKMFVALVAFLAAHDSLIPPVLLIDEAENHLHIDAQADLVGMFVSQELAARVIYTTHSPACLPPDLGTGIRAIVPLADKPQESEIRNSFWTSGPGYSPLMVAMGAGAAAFTTARYVVLAEGASEMILLPSILRKATGLDILPYQVAPGLSEVPKEFYSSLDLEGAKVAYALDNDAGGVALRENLVQAGVPERVIVMLPVPGLENLLAADVYASAVFELLKEQYSEDQIPALPILAAASECSWAAEFKTWARESDIQLPSKVAVASRILERGEAGPSADLVQPLINVHSKILAALNLESSRGS